MRIGFISTRLNGTDGVSLEVEKWATVLKRMGHEIYYCAGELGGYAAGGTLIPMKSARPCATSSAPIIWISLWLKMP